MLAGTGCGSAESESRQTGATEAQVHGASGAGPSANGGTESRDTQIPPTAGREVPSKRGKPHKLGSGKGGSLKSTPSGKTIRSSRSTEQTQVRQVDATAGTESTGESRHGQAANQAELIETQQAKAEPPDGSGPTADEIAAMKAAQSRE